MLSGCTGWARCGASEWLALRCSSRILRGRQTASTSPSGCQHKPATRRVRLRRLGRAGACEIPAVQCTHRGRQPRTAYCTIAKFQRSSRAGVAAIAHSQATRTWLTGAEAAAAIMQHRLAAHSHRHAPAPCPVHTDTPDTYGTFTCLSHVGKDTSNNARQKNRAKSTRFGARRRDGWLTAASPQRSVVV